MGTCVAATDNADEGNFSHQAQKIIKMRLPNQYGGYDEVVNYIDVSDDKSTLAIGWGSDKIQIVKVDGWAQDKSFEGCCHSKRNGTQIKTAFNPQGQVLAYRWNDKVRLRTIDGAMIKELKNKDKWVTSEFSPGGVYIAIGSTSDTIRYFNATKDSESALIGEGKARNHHQWSQYVNMQIKSKWCPDISNGYFNVVRYNKNAMVYKVTDDGVSLDCELVHDADISDIFFSQDGKLLLTGQNNGNYRVWDFATRQKIKDIKGVAFSMKMSTNFQGSFAPDNHALAVMGEGKNVHVYKTADLTTPDEALPLVLQSDVQSCAIEWSPDSLKLAIGAWKETVVIAVEEKFKVAKVQISSWDQIGSSVTNPKWIDNDTIVGRWDKEVKVIKLN